MAYGVRRPEAKRPETPQGQGIQGLPRPEIQPEGPRRRRSPRQPARPRCRHLGEREDTDTGVWADADASADETRPSRDPRPRLQAQRHKLPDGELRPRRRADRAWSPDSCNSRQRLLPQVRRRQRMAEGPPRPKAPFHPNIGLADDCCRGPPPNAEGTGSSTRSSNRSTSTSRRSRDASSIAAPMMPARFAGPGARESRGGMKKRHHKLQEVAT